MAISLYSDILGFILRRRLDKRLFAAGYWRNGNKSNRGEVAEARKSQSDRNGGVVVHEIGLINIMDDKDDHWWGIRTLLKVY